MPHRRGDPLPCMSPNQRRVHKAYGSMPVWLDHLGNFVCQLCNHGADGCDSSCLLAGVMECMRKDIRFLDEEDARCARGAPTSPEEIAKNFYSFCTRPDVSAMVSGERLYADFIQVHRIILVLQILGPWLRAEGERYAATMTSQDQPLELLTLKCERAITYFLRLDLNRLSLEDTLLLSNMIESSGVVEGYDAVMLDSIQKVLDLISVAHTFNEMQGQDNLLQEMLNQQQTQQQQNPQLNEQLMVLHAGMQPLSSSESNSVNLDQQQQHQQLQHHHHHHHQQQYLELTPQQLDVFSPQYKVQEPMTLIQDLQYQQGQQQQQQHVQQLPTGSQQQQMDQPMTRMQSSDLNQQKQMQFIDDPCGPRRCKGRTQSGARCKLTEESASRLHGRCADAAKPLKEGAKYCKFHKDQEFHAELLGPPSPWISSPSPSSWSNGIWAVMEDQW
eukprot:TRINITY_DN2156_c2_g1_i2.p1 TRINITY_DN2156_c2_g1~~TRINITY_DN2156_c2_g1_i2.p1  ORF type:complete len:444 (+),score=93.54 TRINITY_DN2156_c2_g1_i2:160-1491(+)